MDVESDMAFDQTSFKGQLTLPNEIIHNICEYFCHSLSSTTFPPNSRLSNRSPSNQCTDTIRVNRRTLANLCQASKLLRDTTQDLLYRTFEYDIHHIRDGRTRLDLFLTKLEQNPKLAPKVKCLTIDKCIRNNLPCDWENQDGSSGSGSNIIAPTIQYQYANALLQMTRSIHTITISPGHWVIAPNYPQLRTLCLQRHSLVETDEISNDENDTTHDTLELTAESFLGAAPQLVRLGFVCWDVSERLCRAAVRDTPQIAEITISGCTGEVGSFEILIKGLENLSVFELNDEGSSFPFKRNFLSPLLPRQRNMTTISIKGPEHRIDFRLLQNFEQLNKLNLECHIDNIPKYEEFNEEASPVLPSSLAWLGLCDESHDLLPTSRLVAALSCCRSIYSKLKYVKIDTNDKQLSENVNDAEDLLIQQNVEQTFKKGGIKFESNYGMGIAGYLAG